MSDVEREVAWVLWALVAAAVWLAVLAEVAP